jgi:hypothetical protein
MSRTAAQADEAMLRKHTDEIAPDIRPGHMKIS